MKIATLGAFAAIGLTSAAIAQPKVDHSPSASAPADQESMMQGMMQMKQERMSGE